MKKRDEWIDLVRGMAVIGMVETHTTNSFLNEELRVTPVFDSLTYLNGLVAPIFFWVMGYVRGSSPNAGAKTRPAAPVVKRLLFIMMIGYLMHGPAELLTGRELGRDLWWRVFMVDVLQCLSVSGLIIIAAEKARLFCPAVVIAALIFVVVFADQAQNWRTGFIPFDSYLTSQHGSIFPLFPWAGFAFSGFLTRRLENHPGTIAVSGILLAAIADRLPLLDSTSAFFLERLGWVTLIAMGTRLWIAPRLQRLNSAFKWLTLSGRESLTVYVVHLSLIHAIPWPGGSLDVRIGPTQNVWITTLLFVVLLFLSLGVAYFKSRRTRSSA